MFANNSPGISVNTAHPVLNKEKLFGITLDKNLGFNCHVDDICKKTGQTCHGLAGVPKLMDQEKLHACCYIVSI